MSSPKSRSFTRFSIGLVLLVGAALVAIKALAPRTKTSTPRDFPVGKRSVVVVTVDTTRADRLEPYGAVDIDTPTFSNLAQSGVLFENAASVAPITLPAHTSIMTGLYPFEHGVRNNGTHYVPEDVVTLAEHFRDEGYRTGAMVSAAVLEKRYGLSQGFEVYDDDLSTGANRGTRAVADRPAGAAVDRAVEWLDSLGSDEKFFLWVHFYDPHAAYSPPAPFRDDYRERLYDGEIAYMDSQLGRLLRHDRVAASQDGPLVAVIGDHGESLGEHGERTHAILAYDSTLHVPMLLRVPGGPAGLRISQPVSQIDLAPTILAAVGLEQEVPMRGQSLLGLMSGAPPEPSRVLYSESYLPYYTYGWAKLQVARRDRWKYIDAPTPELYDIQKDPRELSSVHGSKSGVAHDLKRDLAELLGSVEDSERETSLQLDDEAREKLRSLGYVAAGSVPASQGPRADPKDVVDLHVGLERGRNLMTDRLWELAEKQFRAVLDRDPSNISAMIELVGCLEGQERVDEAARIAEGALALDPNYQRLYVLLGRLEIGRGEVEKGLGLLKAGLERDPRNPSAVVAYSSALESSGRRADAEAVLEEALEAAPDDPRLNVAWARSVELRDGDLEASEARLRKALEKDPYLTAGWRQLGRTLERAGRREEAIDVYVAGLEHEVDSVELHGALGILLAELERHDEAEQQLREALRLSPRFEPSLAVSLGGVLASTNRLQEARTQYERVLDRVPRHADARNNLAIALYRSGERRKARDLLIELTEERPQHADAHNNLAGIAVDAGNWREAELRARRALELDGEIVEAWNNLGVALDETGKADEARDCFEKALALDDGYWPAELNLGLLLRKQGLPEEAKSRLEHVLELMPSFVPAHLELGEIFLEDLEQPDRARAHFQAVLRMNPTHPRAEELKRALDGM